MKIGKEIRKFLDYELSHYKYYKRKAEKIQDGKYKASTVIKIADTLERIENVKQRLDMGELEVFNLYYGQNIKNTVKIIGELSISYSTFNRRINHIIEIASEEWGFDI